MDRSIPMLLIGLVFGAGLGFVFAAANGITLDGHDHGAHGHGAQPASHDHGEPRDLPLGSATVAARLEPDSASGWNLFLQAQGFCFAPDQAGEPDRPGQGHAHLYLNGAKIARLYGPAFHLDALAPGDRLRIELNANDHRPLTVAGQPLAVEMTLPRDSQPLATGPADLPPATLCPAP